MAGSEVLFGVTNTKPPMLTMHDVERRYGINWFTATRVAKLAGVLNCLRSGDAPGPKVILAEDADRLFARFVDVVSITVLAQEVGATQKQLVALIDAGYLKPAFDKQDVLMSFWRPDVELFLRSLASRAVLVAEREPHMASIRRAAWRSAPNFLAVVNAILNGRIRWIGHLPDGQLFQTLLVRRDEVAEVLGQRGDPNALRQSDLCKRWKVKSEAIVELINRGVLTADEVGRRGRPFCIRRDSVEVFEQTYMSVKRLALKYGVDWKGMKGTVERHGIKPAFAELRGCFYRRDELRRVKLI
jgi:hypothetical protein